MTACPVETENRRPSATYPAHGERMDVSSHRARPVLRTAVLPASFAANESSKFSRLSQRQAQHDRRALPIRSRRDRAACDWTICLTMEAQPVPRRCGCALVDPVKALENMGQVVRGMPMPLSPRAPPSGRRAARRKGRCAGRIGIGDGVFQEVEHHLLQRSASTSNDGRSPGISIWMSTAPESIRLPSPHQLPKKSVDADVLNSASTCRPPGA